MSSLEERLARHRRPASTRLRADDALKYAAAILAERYNWVSEAIGCSEACGDSGEYGDDVHGTDLEAMGDVVRQISALAARFGDPRHYADGRQVSTNVDIARGFGYGHIWHPGPAEEKPQHESGEIPSFDPDLPSPGRWEIRTDPATQKIYGRVVKAV